MYGCRAAWGRPVSYQSAQLVPKRCIVVHHFSGLAIGRQGVGFATLLSQQVAQIAQCQKLDAVQLVGGTGANRGVGEHNS